MTTGDVVRDIVCSLGGRMSKKERHLDTEKLRSSRVDVRGLSSAPFFHETPEEVLSQEEMLENFSTKQGRKKIESYINKNIQENWNNLVTTANFFMKVHETDSGFPVKIGTGLRAFSVGVGENRQEGFVLTPVEIKDGTAQIPFSSLCVKEFLPFRFIKEMNRVCVMSALKSLVGRLLESEKSRTAVLLKEFRKFEDNPQNGCFYALKTPISFYLTDLPKERSFGLMFQEEIGFLITGESSTKSKYSDVR